MVSIGRDGKFPGGGGFGFTCTTFSSTHNGTSYCGSGANGAINIYFDVLTSQIIKEEDVINSGNISQVNILKFIPLFLLMIYMLTNESL